MTDEEFEARPPEVAGMLRAARRLRTDREVIDEVEARVVRIESKLVTAIKSLGLSANGKLPEPVDITH